MRTDDFLVRSLELPLLSTVSPWPSSQYQPGGYKLCSSLVDFARILQGLLSPASQNNLIAFCETQCDRVPRAACTSVEKDLDVNLRRCPIHRFRGLSIVKAARRIEYALLSLTSEVRMFFMENDSRQQQ